MLITLLLHVALAVPPTAAVSGAVVDAALTEAAHLWAPYGVTIDGGWPPRGAEVVTVVPILTRRPAAIPGWRGALGAITFAPDGAPVPAISLFWSDIEQLVAGAHMLGTVGRFWPSTLRDAVLGRVVGRVLAHEIGHYLLRSPRHSRDGLMRPLQLADDLVSPSRHRFALTAADAARLEDVDDGLRRMAQK